MHSFHMDLNYYHDELRFANYEQSSVTIHTLNLYDDKIILPGKQITAIISLELIKLHVSLTNLPLIHKRPCKYMFMY